MNTRDLIGEQATLSGLVSHTLTSFEDDKVETLRPYAFYNQSQLKEISLPNVTTLGDNAFNGCTGAVRFKIALDQPSVITGNTNAFSRTGIRSVIYVPDELVSSYKSNSGWSSLSSRIHGISEMPEPEWDETEITDTDEQLFTRINNGSAASYYKLGQYKSVNFGTLGTLRMQIIGINVDELSDGSGNAQLTWFPMEFPSSTRSMNPSRTPGTSGTGTIGGWGNCKMRTYLNSDVWALIPSGWQNVIKEVKKYSRIYNTSEQVENNVLTYDKIWLLSSREVNNTNDSATYNETQGPVYSLAFAEDSTRVRKIGASANYWWLRSAAWNVSCFARVDSSGSWNSGTGAHTEHGIGFGFCT